MRGHQAPDFVLSSIDDGTLEIYCNGISSVARNGVTLSSAGDFTYDAAKKLLTVSYSGATNLQISGTASIF